MRTLKINFVILEVQKSLRFIMMLLWEESTTHKILHNSLTKFCSNPNFQLRPRVFWIKKLPRSVVKRRIVLGTFRKNLTPDNSNVLQEATITV